VSIRTDLPLSTYSSRWDLKTPKAIL